MLFTNNRNILEILLKESIRMHTNYSEYCFLYAFDYIIEFTYDFQETQRIRLLYPNFVLSGLQKIICR